VHSDVQVRVEDNTTRLKKRSVRVRAERERGRGKKYAMRIDET